MRKENLPTDGEVVHSTFEDRLRAIKESDSIKEEDILFLSEALVDLNNIISEEFNARAIKEAIRYCEEVVQKMEARKFVDGEKLFQSLAEFFKRRLAFKKILKRG
ncbi:MAG: hypothetical protein ABII10_00375 [Candidatus Paceibacterota bacterium]